MKTEVELVLPECEIEKYTLTVLGDVDEWWVVKRGGQDLCSCCTYEDALLLATALNEYIQNQKIQANLAEINAELQSHSEINA